jgi:hypothetical protein
MNLLFNISSMPAVLMYAALKEQDLLCRVFGRCRHGAPIDREVGHLMQGEGLLKDRSFSYGDLRRVGRAVALEVTPEHFDAYLKAAP